MEDKGFMHSVVDYCRNHQLQCGVGLWGALMVGTFLNVYRKRTTIANKIITARLVSPLGFVLLTSACWCSWIIVTPGCTGRGSGRDPRRSWDVPRLSSRKEGSRRLHAGKRGATRFF